MSNKKNLERQKRDRISRLFQNSVGVTASATAVVVATPLFDNVAAEFTEFKLLEDSIYYEVEVIEDVPEDGTANGRPLRLVIENQWERIEVDLDYGLNEDVLNELRPNANYSFTVQMDKGVTWVTLANETVTTEDELAGVIGPVPFTETEDAFTASVDLYTQSGGVEIQFYQLALIEGDQTLEQIPVDPGEFTAELTFPKTNQSFRLELQAITAESELIVLDEKTVNPPAYFEASMTAELIGPTEALIQPRPDLDAFPDQTYTVLVLENGQLIESLEGTSDYVLELAPESEYQLIYQVNYVDARTGEAFQRVLAETTLETPADIFYVLNIIDDGTTRDYLLSVENYDTWFTQAVFRQGGTSLNFTRVSTVGSTTLFRYQTSSETAAAEVQIILVLNTSTATELIIYP